MLDNESLLTSSNDQFVAKHKRIGNVQKMIGCLIGGAMIVPGLVYYFNSKTTPNIIG